MSQNYLLFIAQDYSFEILRPLQQAILARGGNVLWFVYGKDVTISHFKQDECFTQEASAAVAFSPVATYVPGNVVPNFIPGLKVQVFHGLEWKKKGHFVMRGCFDLYCTHGRATTERFEQLAQQHGHFGVAETGWPKLDPLFSAKPYQWSKQNDRPIVLFAPTFSPALTAAPALFEQISALVKSRDWQWLVKFHPKMDPQWVAQYQQIMADNYHVVEGMEVAHLLQCADLLVSDTSSIIGEFALLSKPVVTLNNAQPGDYLIDIDDPDQLESSIELALTPSEDLQQHVKEYAQDLHPYADGLSAQRILEATDKMLNNKRQGLKTKPLNVFRNLKMRKKLSYWKF